MFSQISCFFLVSCIYSQVNSAPGRNRDEDSDFTFLSDKVGSYINDEYLQDAVNNVKRSFNDKNEIDIDNDKVAEISDNVQHTFEDEFQKRVGLVADKVQHDGSNFVEKTKNIANKFYESGMDALKNTGESVRNSLDKSVQSTGEFFDAGIKTSKDNLETLLNIGKTPFQQSVNFMNDLFG